jgi:alpha-L-rhamnosidase
MPLILPQRILIILNYNNMKSIAVFKCLFFTAFTIMMLCNAIKAQNVDPLVLNSQWKAWWITAPNTDSKGYGVYYFRKQVEFASKPAVFLIHVSADNRYKLYVNQKLVLLGPPSGDIAHWNFQTLDIAPFIVNGKNTVAAQVWNEGDWRPEAQISLKTGFILQGDGDAEVLNTGISWKCIADSSYSPLQVKTRAYHVAGSGEMVNQKTLVKDWQKNDIDESKWRYADLISPGIPVNTNGEDVSTNAWLLQPSILPPMELTLQRLRVARQKTAGITIPAEFPAQKKQVLIPANSTAIILLDQGFLTNAYPTLVFSGGRGGALSLTYAEALYIKYPKKGNRNEIDGKMMLGRSDSVISDGSVNQQFTPLSWRTYRYLQLIVTTGNDALTIDDIYGTFIGYPFKLNSSLVTDNPEIKQIMDIGWRTARLNAVETYMDCPYYEQLQYIGDTRIQAMVSLYNSGDDRLIRNALNNMDNSRRPEGVTLSRHPSKTPQYIPTFSLWYLGMLHDYWMYGNDEAFVKDKLPGERQVLNFFNKYQQEDGSLANVPYWMFTDWVTGEGWHTGRGPKGSDGTSALVDLQLLWAYQVAADMEKSIGMKDYALGYTQKAEQLKATIRKKYWDAGRRLFADKEAKDVFSQHTNSLAILTEAAEQGEKLAIAKKILADSTLAPASIYFKYYMHQALVKAGLGSNYTQWLGKWRENIEMGLTTWGETSQIDTTRSDCHAWGASPNIEFFRTLLGIDTDAPGFNRVKIEPHLGSLKFAKGTMPHPKGSISVDYAYRQKKWYIKVVLPTGIVGTFIWNGKTYPLAGGSNQFKL